MKIRAVWKNKRERTRLVHHTIMLEGMFTDYGAIIVIIVLIGRSFADVA